MPHLFVSDIAARIDHARIVRLTALLRRFGHRARLTRTLQMPLYAPCRTHAAGLTGGLLHVVLRRAACHQRNGDCSENDPYCLTHKRLPFHGNALTLAKPRECKR